MLPFVHSHSTESQHFLLKEGNLLRILRMYLTQNSLHRISRLNAMLTFGVWEGTFQYRTCHQNLCRNRQRTAASRALHKIETEWDKL